ncbi:hypothetical protein [Kitasatospora phosalacinea]|uniref:Uncharacterized protein n=1 Tax=Kitasatospora phosalacinea TaxID=2065 RepID=A0A9W6UR69_9ACTN|nr:hypothetical protein [Kitasatospora phosalacinea]GLW56847.1 hypothetical protein Kpho01_48580 [Kitasatospora phosalacinea]
MGEVPGAREEPERSGHARRAQPGEPPEEPTPGADQGHEPPPRRRAAAPRAERPAEAGAARARPDDGSPDDGGPNAPHRGRAPAATPREPEQPRRPEPVRTAETVTPGYVLCYECDGLGACDSCDGRGWLPGEPPGRRRCRVCFARRVCPVCRGGGELAVSDLSTYQLGYYPGLRPH